MPADKIGSIKQIGTDKQGRPVWRVKVQVGSNDDRRESSVTVHGSRRDAELAATRLRAKMASSPIVSAGLTLDEYFHGPFLESCSERHLANATVKSYSEVFKKVISPRDGSKAISSIDESVVRRTIEESSSPRNTRRTYSAIMNRARTDGVIPRKIDFDGIGTATKRKAKRPMRWTASELLDAAEAVRGDEVVEPYLLIASAGLRKEEVLGLMPSNFSVVDVRKGERTEKVLIARITGAYTDDDGMKDTKTEESVRTVPMLGVFSERIMEILRDLGPKVEQVGDDAFVISYLTGWRSSREIEYEERFFEGTEEQAEKEAAAIEREMDRGPRSPRVIVAPFGDDYFTLKIPIKHFNRAERVYEKEPFHGTEREARHHAAERWGSMRLLPCTANYLRFRWENSLKRHGIRYVPPSFLRKSSESLMAAAGIGAASIQKIHGHTTFKTDFAHYIDLDLESIVQAHDAVDEHLRGRAGGMFTVSRPRPIGEDGA